MIVEIHTIWGKKKIVLSDEIERLEGSFRDLMRGKHEKEILKLMQIRNALLDGFTILPPKVKERLVKILEKLELLEARDAIH